MRGLDICKEVWDSIGIPGYVSLACGYSKGKGQKGAWEDSIFHYPHDKDKIEEWFECKSKEECNLYWCPVVFSKARRKKEYALGSTVLYADLDEVDPRELQEDIQPTVAWKSSENRYQALWRLDKLAGPLELESLNKRLAYFTGADKSGWDLTQVLRIPGTINYQYGSGVQGQLLWENNELAFETESFEEVLPVINEVSTKISSEQETTFELIAKYKNQIPQEIRSLLQYPPEQVTPGKRSEVLFKIESALVEAKIPIEDIYAMVQGSSWNKFRTRPDERERLMSEIRLAYSKHQTGYIREISEEESEFFNVESMEDLLGRPRTKSGWMVKGFWLKGSNGIVAGEPKTFKSTLTLDLAISIASGRPFLDRYPVEETGPVLIIQNENAEWIIQDRLERMMVGKDLVGNVIIDEKGKELDITFPPNVPVHFLNNQGFDFGLDEHREKLEEHIKRIKPVMVIFDPLYLMFEGDINSAKEVQPILKWLTEVKNKYKTAVIVVHHFRKGETARSGQRMLGSVTFHGWTESSIFLSAKPISVSTVTDQLTIEEENKPEEMEIEVDREFRAEGPRPRVYLKMNMGDEQNQTYDVEVHNMPYAKYSKGDFVDDSGLRKVEITESKGVIREVRKSEISNENAQFHKVKSRIETLVGMHPITEVRIEELNENIFVPRDKIREQDLLVFCQRTDPNFVEPILENGKTVGVKLLNGFENIVMLKNANNNTMGDIIDNIKSPEMEVQNEQKEEEEKEIQQED